MKRAPQPGTHAANPPHRKTRPNPAPTREKESGKKENDPQSGERKVKGKGNSTLSCHPQPHSNTKEESGI